MKGDVTLRLCWNGGPLRLPLWPGRALIVLVLAGLALAGGLAAGCTPVRDPAAQAAPGAAGSAAAHTASACPVTTPQWRKPPRDAAVLNEPQEGYYFVNDSGSMWAAAPPLGQAGSAWRSGEDGVKVGWFRPAGAALAIRGERTDGPAPPLAAHIPCCYPTRFQATGLVFSAPGCWRIHAEAGGDELSFTVWVEP